MGLGLEAFNTPDSIFFYANNPHRENTLGAAEWASLHRSIISGCDKKTLEFHYIRGHLTI